MEDRVKALEEELEELEKRIGAGNASYWKLAGYLSQMVVRF